MIYKLNLLPDRVSRWPLNAFRFPSLLGSRLNAVDARLVLCIALATAQQQQQQQQRASHRYGV